MSSAAQASSPIDPTAKVLVYSSNRLHRQQVLTSLGVRPSADGPRLTYVECATEPALLSYVDTQTFDLLILDGEATPAGGLGLARQMKDEIFHCPPILVLLGRAADAWLATWSRADAAVTLPVNPVAIAQEVNTLLSRRRAVSA